MSNIVKMIKCDILKIFNNIIFFHTITISFKTEITQTNQQQQRLIYKFYLPATRWRQLSGAIFAYLKYRVTVTALFIAPLRHGPLNHHMTSTEYVGLNEWRETWPKFFFSLLYEILRALSGKSIRGFVRFGDTSPLLSLSSCFQCALVVCVCVCVVCFCCRFACIVEVHHTIS